MSEKRLIEHLFRIEFGKIVAILCKTFGLSTIQIAEDIVSDTFLLASETWGLKGVPNEPKAWLYKVAINNTKDFLKRDLLFHSKIKPYLEETQSSIYSLNVDFSESNISDSQLQMLFAVCDPAISKSLQISLALRILCGFSVDEIANAFLCKKSVINKRLYRAKIKLRENTKKLCFPDDVELNNRIESVLSVIYLLFNEGYYSSVNNRPIRKDLCLEALRLGNLLRTYKPTQLPQVSALLALMCFHLSRFEARLNNASEQILYYEQDKSKWDFPLIEKGILFLSESACGKNITKYHLEAGISYWHTTVEDSKEKWDNILQLYNQLLQIGYSPVVALNRTYAFSKVHGKEQALKEAEKISLNNNRLYHLLIAYLLENNLLKKKYHLEQALEKTTLESEKKVILFRLTKLKSKKT
jgi:RNA polymerase sigma-70 factor (ECF subfamily)